MQLIYLWIEEFKCIKQKEFHFSNKYKIIYNNKKNHITITKNKINLTPINSLNSFAIVGKNGSGKSTFMEAIMLTLSAMPERDKKKCNLTSFCIFEYKDELYHSYSAQVENNFSLPYNLNTQDINKTDFFILHSNNSLETFSNEFCNCLSSSEYCGFIYDLEITPNQKNFLSFPDKSNNNIDINNINLLTKKMMTEVLYLKGTNKLDDLLNNISSNNNGIHFKPDLFKLSFSFRDTYLKQFKNKKVRETLRKMFKNNNTNINHLNKEILLKLTIMYIIFRIYESFNGLDLIEHVNEDYIKNQDFIYILKMTIKFMEYIDNINKDIEKLSFSNLDEDTKYANQQTKINLENEIDNIIRNFENETINHFNHITQAMYNIRDSLIGKSIKSLFYDIYKAVWYYEYIRDKKDNFDYFYRKTHTNYDTLELLASLPYYIDVELWTKKTDGHLIKFDSLSYGEKVVVKLIYNLLYYIEKIKNKNFKHLTLIFDELENGLSPEWQAKFYNFIYKLLDEVQKENYFESITFIPITHSPFILTDFFQENILYIDSCQQIQKTEETFGSNIHTLLSDSFFMESGLIGDFAKELINEVINNLNNTKESLSKQKIKNIIERIGEPFLKTKLFELYENKYREENELELLEKEKKIIEDKINKLKSKKQ
jgi:predicted ATPase